MSSVLLCGTLLIAQVLSYAQLAGEPCWELHEAAECFSIWFTMAWPGLEAFFNKLSSPGRIAVIITSRREQFLPLSENTAVVKLGSFSASRYSLKMLCDVVFCITNVCLSVWYLKAYLFYNECSTHIIFYTC